jgi:hypothetical protein
MAASGALASLLSNLPTPQVPSHPQEFIPICMLRLTVREVFIITSRDDTSIFKKVEHVD